MGRCRGSWADGRILEGRRALPAHDAPAALPEIATDDDALRPGAGNGAATSRSDPPAGARADLPSAASSCAATHLADGRSPSTPDVEPGRRGVAPSPALYRRLTALQRSETTPPVCGELCGDCPTCLAALDLFRDANDEIRSALRQVASAHPGYETSRALEELDDAVIALRRSLGVPRDWIPADADFADASCIADINAAPAVVLCEACAWRPKAADGGDCAVCVERHAEVRS